MDVVGADGSGAGGEFEVVVKGEVGIHAVGAGDDEGVGEPGFERGELGEDGILGGLGDGDGEVVLT